MKRAQTRLPSSVVLGASFALAVCTAAHAQDGQLAAPSVLIAKNEATLSSLMDGQIEVLPAEVGDAFLAGDVLLKLDCDISEAVASSAAAEASSLEAEFASKDALSKRGAIGTTDVAIAKGRMEAAKSQARVAELRVDWCVVEAPFDGRVVEVSVNQHEFVQAGQPLLSVVSAEAPFLEIIAPAEWLKWLRIGVRGRVDLPSLQTSHEVEVTRIAPVVDPVSRTVKLRAAFLETHDSLLPGMSGLVHFGSG